MNKDHLMGPVFIGMANELNARIGFGEGMTIILGAEYFEIFRREVRTLLLAEGSTPTEDPDSILLNVGETGITFRKAE